MNKLIIDAANDKIFLMIIDNNTNYSITHENTKINFEKLTLLINEFLSEKMDLKKFQKFMSTEAPEAIELETLLYSKAFHLANKIDYYGFSFDDFSKNDVKYENIPNYKKLKVKKFD